MLNKIMNLTKKQIDVLMGTILGDGFLQKTGKQNARLRLEHSLKQKDYLIWKGKIFNRLFQGTPSYLERIHPNTKEVYKYVRWQSSSSPSFGKWHKYFYPNGKKTIPKDLGKYLISPLSLAVWYMDDGYYSKDRNCFIYLGKISLQEGNILQDIFNKNFGLNPKLYNKKNKGLALFFGVGETKKFHQIIKEFIIDSLHYKISLTP
jgi:hypothetical protein